MPFCREGVKIFPDASCHNGIAPVCHECAGANVSATQRCLEVKQGQFKSGFILVIPLIHKILQKSMEYISNEFQ